jgi:hypothetical protein
MIYGGHPSYEKAAYVTRGSLMFRRARETVVAVEKQ